jgi:predicted membrane protein
MSVTPVIVDDFDLTVKNLKLNLTLHPLIIIVCIFLLISTIVNIIYISILLYNLKKKEKVKFNSRTDLYIEEPPMVDPTKSNYLRL